MYNVKYYTYIHLMCVYFRFLWDAMCFLSSLMPYHPAHLRPWATTVSWTSSQSCSTNNMATLSMTVEVAGFQHGDGAIELSMYNVKYYIQGFVSFGANIHHMYSQFRILNIWVIWVFPSSELNKCIKTTVVFNRFLLLLAFIIFTCLLALLLFIT